MIKLFKRKVNFFAYICEQNHEQALTINLKQHKRCHVSKRIPTFYRKGNVFG